MHTFRLHFIGTQPRAQEVEHFLGTLEDVKKYSTPPPSLIHYDLEDPHRIARSVDMAERVEPTPAFPIVSILLVYIIHSDTELTFSMVVWPNLGQPILT